MEDLKQDKSEADRAEEDCMDEDLQLSFEGDGKNSLQYAGPIYIDSAQMASLLLLQSIHLEHKNHKMVFQMDDCIPLKVMVSKPSVLPEELQTRECCYKCFSEHEENNRYGPHDCEVRTKHFFRACAEHWRWCRQE